MENDEVLRLGRELLDSNRLSHWHFRISSRAKSRLGVCKPRIRTIELSEFYTRQASLDQITGTIKHEIAHALTPFNHHGREWASKCNEFGISSSRLATHTVIQTYQVWASCTCPHTFNRHRKPRRQLECLACHTHLVWHRY